MPLNCRSRKKKKLGHTNLRFIQPDSEGIEAVMR